MNWASRRRFLYIAGILIFFAVLASIPITAWLYEPATCFDEIRNQGETAIDRGGPCKLLDARRLIPHSILWSRPFLSRKGVHSAVAYIENPNQGAGVKEAPYRIRIYDDKNVLVGEREGVTSIMPGTITPVFEGEMMSGERLASRAFFEFIAPLVWERLRDRSSNITITDRQVKDIESAPQVSAIVTNDDVVNFRDVEIVAVVFDTAGNAFAASRTVLPRLDARDVIPVTFTWSQPFIRRVSRVDMMAVVPPAD
ncbi:hypothetical protein HY413_03255 [Candidatus Kaiserbacteria bacterium]|nr:hypothetical protein [Candidatus Kaiserbacteria bacterium]